MKNHSPDSIEPYNDYKHYSEKGVLISSNHTDFSIYNSNKKIISKFERVYYSRGKEVYRFLESFSPEGLPLNSQTFGRKNKSIKTIEYIYNGKTEIIVNHFIKGKLSDSYKGSLSYY